MKKIAILMMSALALFTFASCDDEKHNVDLDNVIEEGFFVAGPATGSETLLAKNAMAAGFNEVTKNTRTGMYEKYVVLKGGEDFYLLLNEGTSSTRYAATLETFNPGANSTDNPAYGENPNMDLLRGRLEVGKNDLAMRVEKTGLYHILLDLNQDKDAPLEYPQILVAPCNFTLSYGDKPMELNVEGDKYIWTWEGANAIAGTFKFRYCLGWKVTLDADGLVKAETSFGSTTKAGALSSRGGKDINLGTGENIKVSLTYENKPGDISNSFSYTIEGQEKTDFSKLKPGISGDLHSSMPLWSDPCTTLATYNAAESKEGEYVYDMTGVAIKADAVFKMRLDNQWLNFEQVIIEGIDVEIVAPDGDKNIGMKSQAGTYSIKVILTSKDGIAVDEDGYKAIFTRTGDLPAEVEPEPTPELNIANFPAVEGKIAVYAETTYVNLYGWLDNNEGEIAGGWPGKAKEAVDVVVDGVTYAQFLLDGALNGKTAQFILNGSGSQTGDSEKYTISNVMVFSVLGTTMTLTASK